MRGQADALATRRGHVLPRRIAARRRSPIGNRFRSSRSSNLTILGRTKYESLLILFYSTRYYWFCAQQFPQEKTFCQKVPFLELPLISLGLPLIFGFSKILVCEGVKSVSRQSNIKKIYFKKCPPSLLKDSRHVLGHISTGRHPF